MTYAAILHSIPGKPFLVSFPDTPGAAIPCATLRQAKKVAELVILARTRLWYIVGHPTPEPVTEETLSYLEDIFGACAVVVVSPCEGVPGGSAARWFLE